MSSSETINPTRYEKRAVPKRRPQPAAAVDASERAEPKKSTIDAIKDSLTCPICYEIVELPVLPTCCKTGQPACLTCVRAYYQMNKAPTDRDRSLKNSWTGCGHKIDPFKAGSGNAYTDATQLYGIRDHFGPSKCPNNCGAVFETQASLRRHLRGEASESEPPNCPESRTKCKICGMYGTRRDIDTVHFEKCHSVIKCKWSDVTIKTTPSTYKEDLKGGITEIVNELRESDAKELELMNQLVQIRAGKKAREKAALWALKLASKNEIRL